MLDVWVSVWVKKRANINRRGEEITTLINSSPVVSPASSHNKTTGLSLQLVCLASLGWRGVGENKWWGAGSEIWETFVESQFNVHLHAIQQKSIIKSI
jgi:hypothetical protein